MACTKDEPIKNLIHHPAEEASSNIDPKIWIEELMTTTGIDIYELSELDEVQKIADKQLRIMNATSNTTLTKGGFTEEKAIQIQELAVAIESADRAGNEGEVLRLFESLCAVCRTIDGFIFGEDEYGLQSITYDPSKEPVLLPITQMTAQQANVVALQQTITVQNPQFSTLPQETQTNVLAATIYAGVQRNIMAAKSYSLEDCRQVAKDAYAAALSLATVRCAIDLARCAFTGPATGVCCAVAGARFAVDVTIATIAYNTAVKYC